MTTPFVGLHVPSFTYPGAEGAGLFPRLAEIAATADRSGFTALSVMDHFHQIAPAGQPDEPMLEAYTTLGALAARTDRIQLYTLVSGVIYRNPGHLAKSVTTLDVISGGRAMLGIGAAWNDEESRAYGFAFPPIGERMDRLEEAVQICRAMFDNPTATCEGRHHRVEDAINNPRPVRARIPILIGGSGERRTLRIVARHADACNVLGWVPGGGEAGGPALVRSKLEVLGRHCEAEGRDIADIMKTATIGTMIIDETEAGVRRRLESYAASPPPAMRGMDVDTLARALPVGTPDQVAERIRTFIDTGLDGVTFGIYGVHDLERIVLAATAARSAGLID
jgi:F420-dependent oxidoreductase-like protein